MSSMPASLQPVVVYPNVISTQPSHSKGSFGPVFAVLAVITVLAAVACFLGRLCARRFSSYNKPKRERDRERDRTFHVREDLENGFRSSPVVKPVGKWGGGEAKPDKTGGKDAKPAKYGGIKEAKPAAYGGSKEAKLAAHGGSKEARPAAHGGSKEARPATNGESKEARRVIEEVKKADWEKIKMQKMEEAKKQNHL